MVDTIGPMVRGDRSKAARIRSAHIAGGLVGGALTGFVVGAIGSFLSREWVLAVAGALALIALVWDLARDGKKLGTARQTPRSWRYLLPPAVVSFLNGFDLGLGWSTRIYFVSYLVAMAAALAAGHAVLGAAIGASFGGSRAAAVVLTERRGTSGDAIVPARGRAVGANAAALTVFLVLTVALALLG